MAHIMMDKELSEWTRNLLLANGIDNEVTQVRRVILDIGIEACVTLYVEAFADKATFEIPPPAFKKINVVRIPESALPPGEKPPEYTRRWALCEECLLHPDTQHTCPYPNGLPPGTTCDDYVDEHSENDE